MASGRALALLLFASISLAEQPAPKPAPKLPERAADNRAGAVAAVVPTALRNEAAAAVKMEVFWRDVLRTAPNGRMRVALRDGSLLSLGAKSTLLVVQHDPTAQRTVLGLVNGTLRGRIAPQVMRGAEFRIHTRTAIIGVIGTDFAVEADEQRTLITCYSGMVGVRDLTGERKAIVRAGEQLEFDRSSRPRARNLPKDKRRHGQDETHVDGADDADVHVEARLERGLDSKKDKPGDKVTAKTTRDIRLPDGTVLPKGSQLIGRLTAVRQHSRTDSARVGVVFEEAVGKDGKTVPLRATVQAVRAPYAERPVTLAEARTDRAGLRQRDTMFAEKMRAMATGESAAPEPATAASSSGSSGSGGSGGGSSGGGDDSSGGGGGDDSSGGSGSGSDDVSGGSGEIETETPEVETKPREGEKETEVEREVETEHVSEGEDHVFGGNDSPAEFAANHHVGRDDELGESSHGVGGIARTRLLFVPLEQGYDTVLVSSAGNIQVSKGSDLVLRLEAGRP